jgi:glycyl-tRNA synthetase beta chain
MSLPFLLEIGAEEIPDWMIVPALNNLQDMFQSFLDQNGIGGSVESMDATPRRLVLRAEGLKERQEDVAELVLGPPKSAGVGAVTGFARKMGVKPEELGTETTAKGEYLSYRKLTKGRPTRDLLADSLAGLILKIYFPKTMYWNGKGSERFIRPIRWIVALLGDSIVPFEIGRVHSANHTAGHRLLGSKSILVANGNFEEQLRHNGVILSAKERRARIETGIAQLLSGKGLRVKPDEGLLDTLVYITELPTPILGSFAEKYLELPQEILITVMRHHQKNFSVERDDGTLAPNFIAVMNTDADPDGLVRQGNEYVLRDRFNDARFFWEMDQKKKLEDRLDDLAKVTFQAKLGSYREKTTRVVESVGDFKSPEIKRAALLAKCDLTTDMVKEFTDLQGIIGGLYAKAQGEPEPVWRAIYDQYKPASMEDEIPRTYEGQVLSFADKWDTLVSCFGVGLIPTGSKDPFALRRAAQGIVRILAEAKLNIALAVEPGVPLFEFMRDRVDYYFREVRGFKYDEVRACMGAGWNLIPDLEARLLRVQAIRSTPDFEPLAASFKRIKNILTQASFSGGGEIDQALLEPGPEQELYAEYSGHLGEPLESRIASLRPKVDAFFDKVLVNAKEEAVRQNRLTLLHNLLSEFSSIADFSEIVTEK